MTLHHRIRDAHSIAIITMGLCGAIVVVIVGVSWSLEQKALFQATTELVEQSTRSPGQGN